MVCPNWKLVREGAQDIRKSIKSYFRNWIKEIKARIFVIIGESDAHLGFLEAMAKEKMFEKDCFVVGVRLEEYDYNGKMYPI